MPTANSLDILATKNRDVISYRLCRNYFRFLLSSNSLEPQVLAAAAVAAADF